MHAVGSREFVARHRVICPENELDANGGEVKAAMMDDSLREIDPSLESGSVDVVALLRKKLSVT